MFAIAELLLAYLSRSNDNNMIYDQIIISAGAFNEFGANPASLGDNIGIVDFDNAAPFTTMQFNRIKDVISDHRPIYARFRCNLSDDDGLEQDNDDEEEGYARGDVNRDGKTNISDLWELIGILSGMKPE